MVALSRSLATFATAAVLSSSVVAGLVHAEGPNWTWDVCNSKFLYPLQVVSYQVIPETPVVGEPLTIITGYDSRVEIVDGAFGDGTVRVDGGEPTPFNFDLCNAEQVGYTSNFTCPAGPGPFTVNATIPFVVPVHGTFETETSLHNADGLTLLCSRFKVDFEQ